MLWLHVDGRMIWRLRTMLTTVCTASANGRRSLTWKETITHCTMMSPSCSLGKKVWHGSLLFCSRRFQQSKVVLFVAFFKTYWMKVKVFFFTFVVYFVCSWTLLCCLLSWMYTAVNWKFADCSCPQQITLNHRNPRILPLSGFAATIYISKRRAVFIQRNKASLDEKHKEKVEG